MPSFRRPSGIGGVRGPGGSLADPDLALPPSPGPADSAPRPTNSPRPPGSGWPSRSCRSTRSRPPPPRSTGGPTARPAQLGGAVRQPQAAAGWIGGFRVSRGLLTCSNKRRVKTATAPRPPRRRFLAIRRGCAVPGARSGSAGSRANRDRGPLGALAGKLSVSCSDSTNATLEHSTYRTRPPRCMPRFKRTAGEAGHVPRRQGFSLSFPHVA